MAVIETHEEVEYLLGRMDPYNLNKMTYSDIVQLLSSHMVQEPSTEQMVPLLEKFSTLGQEESVREEESRTRLVDYPDL